VRINPKAAGIDVDAKEHVVAVPCDRDPQPVRTFQAFTLELHELAWLKRCGIETVGDGTPRRLLRRVSLAKLTSAPLQF
jgi:hypothetical protein